MSWTERDLANLRTKGLRIEDSKRVAEVDLKPKIKIEKISIEKNTIELFLRQLEQKGLIDGYETEYRFCKARKFRFDYIVPTLMIAIEYEGVFASKSRHTTLIGYSTDCTKYNLAILNGWRVLRYTALNYKNLYTDLEKLIAKTKGTDGDRFI